MVDDQISTTLQVLPPTPQKNDQGMVVFLKGGWSIAGAVSLDTCFGLVATSRGFGTGLRVAGNVGNVLDIELAGTVVIDPHATDVFSLTGHSRLRILDHDVFTGDLRITEHRLALRGRLDLFPASPMLRITGELIGRISDSELHLAGSAMVAAGGYFTLASGRAEITHTGASISGTWLNQTVTFSIQKVDTAIQLQTTLSPISIGDAFNVSDISGTRGPIARLGLGAQQVPSLSLSGRVSLLGISTAGAVSFSDRGFEFTVQGQLFNLFQATVTARGVNLLEEQGFFLQATMHNDLLVYLATQASSAIKNAADDATRQLMEARRQVDDAQRQVSNLTSQIDAMRRTVQGERARDQQRLQDAQAAVQRAQNDVNTLQGQINDTNRTIAQLKNDIDAKKRWYDNLPWYKQSYAWAELSAYATAKGTEITGLYVKLGGLETARGTANGVLELAKQTLHGLEAASKTFPIDADPRVAGLITARETATGALTLANKTLEGVQASVGALAPVADYIARMGLGGLLDVRAARFETTLSVAKGGRVSLSAEVVFMGTPHSLAVHLQLP